MPLDAVIIGTFDYPVREQMAVAEAFSQRDGTYGEFKRNTYLAGGLRHDFSQLLNWTAAGCLGFDPDFNVFEVPSLGAYVLAHALKKAGLTAAVVNLLPRQGAYFKDILEEQPRAAVITTTYYVSSEPVRRLVAEIRSVSPQTKIIVGGPYIYNASLSYSPSELNLLFRHIGADIYVVDSQGEATLTRVVNQLRGHSSGLAFVPNLVYRQGTEWHRTQRIPESNSLDDLSVDWGAFPQLPFPRVAYIRTARSCPFACAFCNYPAIAGDHVVTADDPVLQEMRQLRDLGADYLIVVDDTFNVPVPRFKRLLKRMISERLGLRWISFFRCSNVDSEMLDLMAESGCFAVYLGIESGDEQILRAMNKYATAAQYRRGVAELKARNILTFGSFIVGYPGETEQSVRSTFDFIEETRPDYFNAQLYFHNPISPIHNRREEFGIEGSHYAWRHRTMRWDEASEWTNWLLRSVTGSTQLPLYAFSIWSIPYMLVRGFLPAQIRALAIAAQQNMLNGLAAESASADGGLERLGEVLMDWHQRVSGGAAVPEGVLR